MALEGRIHDGTVVFDQPVPLAEGTLVRVEPVKDVAAAEKSEPKTLLEIMGDFVGAIDDLPSDFAEQHDHYLYGTPKK